MRKLLLPAVAVVVCLLAVGAREPLQELEPRSGGGTSEPSIAVAVNSPLDTETGALLAVIPVANRLIDLTGGEDVIMDVDAGTGTWVSEPFSAASFTRIGLRAVGSGNDASCTVTWQWRENSDYFGPTMSTTSGSFNAGWGVVSGLKGRVTCELCCLHQTAVLSEVSVLLRHE